MFINETDNINSSCISKNRTKSRSTRQMRIRESNNSTYYLMFMNETDNINSCIYKNKTKTDT